MWLLTCTDYFGRKIWQWQDEAQRIRYAISRIEGTEVAPFALTYWRPMTGELGFIRQAGYEFWHVSAEQAVRCLVPSHGAKTSLTQMGCVKYHGDIA